MSVNYQGLGTAPPPTHEWVMGVNYQGPGFTCTWWAPRGAPTRVEGQGSHAHGGHLVVHLPGLRAWVHMDMRVRVLGGENLVSSGHVVTLVNTVVTLVNTVVHCHHTST